MLLVLSNRWRVKLRRTRSSSGECFPDFLLTMQLTWIRHVAAPDYTEEAREQRGSNEDHDAKKEPTRIEGLQFPAVPTQPLRKPSSVFHEADDGLEEMSDV